MGDTVDEWCKKQKKEVGKVDLKDKKIAKTEIMKIDDILDELTSKRANVVNADDESKWVLRVSKDTTLKRDLNDDVTKANSALDDLEENLREKKNTLQRLVVDDEAQENAYENLVDLLAPL